MPRERMDARSGQLARIKKTIRAQTVLAHCSGLSGGARRVPTGELQNQRQHPAQFAALIALYVVGWAGDDAIMTHDQSMYLAD